MNDVDVSTQAENAFKKLIWRNTISLGGSLQQFTTWSLTAVAAIVALLVSNLDSISNLISYNGLRAAVIFFALSLFAGVASKKTGMALTSGLQTLNELEAFLGSESGRNLMNSMASDPKQILMDLASPFVWPMSRTVKKAAEAGLVDHLSTDRKLVRLFCRQIFLDNAHGLLAMVALLIVACSIK